MDANDHRGVFPILMFISCVASGKGTPPLRAPITSSANEDHRGALLGPHTVSAQTQGNDTHSVWHIVGVNF